ncbi:MAG: radical SAM protein [Candidatus Bathyarchaeia archaeon]
MANKVKLLRNFINSFLGGNLFHPMFVHFECTYRCNMRCSFCNVWRRNIFSNEATTAELQKKLSECWELGCLVTSFTGGEPLLREDIKELLEFSNKRIGFYTGLVTNGLLLDRKIDAISKHTDFLAVSFDVNDRNTYYKTRGVDAFEKVKKNIELARAMGIEVNLFSVVTKETFKFINDTIDFAESLNTPIHFSPVDSVPREFTEMSDAEKLKINETTKVLEKLTEAKKKYKRIHFESDYFKFQALGGFNRFIRCSSASTTISLKPDASVALPCPFFTLMTIGKNESLGNRLNSAEARNIIRECGEWNFCNSCSINCMYVASLPKHPYFMMRWIKDKIEMAPA